MELSKDDYDDGFTALEGVYDIVDIAKKIKDVGKVKSKGKAITIPKTFAEFRRMNFGDFVE